MNAESTIGVAVRLSSEFYPPDGVDFGDWLAHARDGCLRDKRVVRIEPHKRRVWVLDRHWTDDDPLYKTMRYLTGDAMYGVTQEEMDEMIQHEEVAWPVRSDKEVTNR